MGFPSSALSKRESPNKLSLEIQSCATAGRTLKSGELQGVCVCVLVYAENKCES